MWKSWFGLGLLASVLVGLHGMASGTPTKDVPLSNPQSLQTALQNASQWIEAVRDQAQALANQAGWPVATVSVSSESDGTRIIEIRIDRGLGIHHLPALSAPQRTTAGPVTVGAGDGGISAFALRRTASIIDDISLPVLRNELGANLGSTQVTLFSSPQSYARALARAGMPQSEIRDIVTKTGGLTVGSQVWIPMYALHGRADLANVLTHELTHVWLNQQQLGDALPTWLNEGMAWLDGMTAEQEVSPGQAQVLAAAYDAQVQEAAASGKLLPLSASEAQILTAEYNAEWVDYMAVHELVRQHGTAALQQFLARARKAGVDAAFRSAFGISITSFEQQFMQSLEA